MNKIRAWDGKRMLYKDVYDHNWYSEPSPNGKLIREVAQNDARNLQTMFHTGLHDKSGKELYQEDIIQLSRTKHYIDWDDDMAQWWIYWREGIPAAPFNSVMAKECELIGNNYENTELMK